MEWIENAGKLLSLNILFEMSGNSCIFFLDSFFITLMDKDRSQKWKYENIMQPNVPNPI